MRITRDEKTLGMIQQDERIVARFWQLVSKGDAETACWCWHGLVRKRLPSFLIERRCIGAARIAWWTATGAFPSGGRFYRTCHNERCVRPDHLAWQVGRSAERALDAFCYCAPSGVAARVSVTGERPQVYRFVSDEAASTLRLAG